MKLKLFSAVIIILGLLFQSPAADKTDILQASTTGVSESLLEKVCFFGDSTTYGLFKYNVNNSGIHSENYYTLSKEQIWVPKDGTFYLGNLATARIALSDGRNLSPFETAKELKPQYLIITVGINGLCSWNKESFTKYYVKMLDIFKEASPKTNLVLQSVFPSGSCVSENLKGFTNDKIDLLNSWIREIAENRSLKYLNTQEALKDENGYLKNEFQNGDGLHLNTKGFNAVLEYIDNNL